MKKVYPFIGLLIVVFTVSLNATEIIDDTRVNFKDENLETCVLNNLRSSNEHVTKAELSKVTSLKCSSQNISSLDGLEEASSLIYLDLSNNNISNLKYISKLSNLNTLKLSNNNIKSTSGIDSLNMLMYLDLSNNDISNISSIENLEHLKSLNLSNNNVSSISSIENLNKLYELKLSDNNIKNLSSIETLSNIKYLDLSHNKIKDISVLENLTELEKVDLSYNEISDVNYFENNLNLQILNLEDNQIRIMPDLHNLNSLVSLNLNNNLITSLDYQLPSSLESLNISNNAIADLSSLSKHNSLQVTALSQEIKLDDIKLQSDNSINYHVVDYDGELIQLKLTANNIGLNSLSDKWYESDGFNSYSGAIYQNINFKPNQTFTSNQSLNLEPGTKLNDDQLETLFDVIPLYGQEIYIDDSSVDYNNTGKYTVVVSDEFGVSQKVEIDIQDNNYPINNEGSGISVDNSNHVQVRLYSKSGVGLPGYEYTITDGDYNVVDVITTDKDGYAESESLADGIYYIKQTGAPKGEELDPNVYELNVGKVETIVQQLEASTSEYESVSDSVVIYESEEDLNTVIANDVLVNSEISRDELEYSEVEFDSDDGSEVLGSIVKGSKPTEKSRKIWIGVVVIVAMGITVVIRKVR